MTRGDLLQPLLFVAVLFVWRYVVGLAAPLVRISVATFATRQGRQRLWLGLVVMTAGLAYGLWAGDPVGWLVFGLLLGGLIALVDDIESVDLPSQLVRQCVLSTVLLGLAGLLGGLWVGLAAEGLETGLLLGLMLGLVLGFGPGVGWVWLRYLLGVWSAAWQKRLPKRPAKFLDWCLDRGLMRMAGPSVQFRHRELQRWLSEKSATPPCSDPRTMFRR